MRLLILTDSRGVVDAEGGAWVAYPVDYSTWLLFLAVFDQVTVLARLMPLQAAPDGYRRMDGDGVEVVGLPYYVGPRGYLFKRGELRRCLQEQLDDNTAVLMRAGSPIGAMAHSLMDRNRPYGVEVGGDPYEIFAPGSISHPLRRFFRWNSVRITRRMVADASAVRYVSNRVLPQRYPSTEGAFTITFPSMQLLDDHFRKTPIVFDDRAYPALVTVGSLDQPYKGVDILLKAVALTARELPELSLRVVGDGQIRGELEALAVRLGIENRVVFTGQLPNGDPIRRELDQAHLFVLASRTEGLPRAMIEAMARGLPCIGTAVGGIPDLLEPDELVPKDDAPALARKIIDVVQNPARMRALSALNLATAAQYRDDVIQERRNAFYRAVRDQTEEWLYHT